MSEQETIDKLMDCCVLFKAEAERYRAALEKIDSGKYLFGEYSGSVAHEALHPTQPAEGSEK